MTRSILIMGAGGHASVVADALMACGTEIIGFTDTNYQRHGVRLLDISVLGDDEFALSQYERKQIHLANGLGGIRNLELRRILQVKFQSEGWTFATVRHPSAIISQFAMMGAGAQALAGSVIQVGAVIGEGSIVNTRAVVEHHCEIGRYVHIAPGAVVCGSVVVGDGCHIGAGAVVRQGVRLGPHTIVGAGAVVIGDHSGGVLLGVPARSSEAVR